MRSDRIATLAVVAGLALLGAVCAGVGGITVSTAGSPPAPIEHHHERHGDHDGRHVDRDA